MDGDVASDIMGSYMMWIACILREIELMTLVDAMYIGYIDRQRMLCKPPSYANYGNSNLGHWINIQGAWGWDNFTIWTRSWTG